MFDGFRRAGGRPEVATMLGDRRRYERQIERLHQRHLMTSGMYALEQDGVPLASIVLNRASVARRLARDVTRGDYRLEPGELRVIKARNKLREVFSCRLTDLIVHGVVAGIVEEAVAPTLSPRVFSYRKGISWMSPISQFAAWIREARRAQPDPLQRDIYVLRGDVDSYTDSIPLGAASPLWPMLQNRFGGALHPLIGDVIRPEIRMNGAVACRVTGLPMGQPIAPVIANLYLGELDDALSRIPGGWYARYGDDFLFAHPRADVARAAVATVDSVLGRLSLTINDRKRQICYLTPAGRPSPEWPEARGMPAVSFLGTRIHANGTVALDKAKVRGLLRDIDRRTATTVRTLRVAGHTDIGPEVCAVVNKALHPRSALTEQRSAALLNHVVTDRDQLEQLDYRIALITASALTGRRGARAFRAVPYRTLREDWGLVSLVTARNAAGTST